MNSIYIYASTILFVLLTLIWNRENLLNFFIKAVFCVSAITGSILSLQILGFVVKV